MSRIALEVEPSRSRARCHALARVVLVLGTLGLAACSEPSGAAGLADAISPHEPAIERFSRWADRTVVSVRPRERERLEETLFSVLRDDDALAVVIVERGGRTPLRLAHPSDTVTPELSFQAVRTRTLGLVEAARDPHDATRVWARLPARSDDGLALTFALDSGSPDGDQSVSTESAAGPVPPR
ncbi:MAG: hypothetical protein K1X94_30595 [Sandaracinaceae bacterium]|nr:hypothetical protein [Sandaracinaceae bacterium]